MKFKEQPLADLTLKDFKQACLAGTDSAAGLDGWAARDIALLSDQAIQHMVDLLNKIELGAPWPQHMLTTRAVFLSKDPAKTSNPLAYRILKITSGWYRKWGCAETATLRRGLLYGMISPLILECRAEERKTLGSPQPLDLSSADSWDTMWQAAA